MLIGGFVCVLQYRDHQQTCLTTRSNTRKYLKISKRKSVSEINISIFNVLDIPSFLISLSRSNFLLSSSCIQFFESQLKQNNSKFSILMREEIRRKRERERETSVSRRIVKLRKSTCIEQWNIREIREEECRGYYFRRRVWVNKLSEYIFIPSKRHVETIVVDRIHA